MSNANKFGARRLLANVNGSCEGKFLRRDTRYFGSETAGVPAGVWSCREEASAYRRACAQFQFRGPAEKAAIAMVTAKWPDR
jgi:hypothetical protein